MATLLITHESFALHDVHPRHPERPARLGAALAGVRAAPVTLIEMEAPEVSHELLAAVHDPDYISAIEEFCLAGGGHLDADTLAVLASWEASRRAAGAGHLAIERLRAGEADNAFLVVRPPGHHAERARAMGFCLFNNIAVAAQEVIGAGERVAVIDWDVHHGNGTEAMFSDSAELLYVSFHQYPFYPGTGPLDEQGSGAGLGYTVNIALPEETAGDIYRRGFGDLVMPLLATYRPDWILVSAGFDAHADDPLAELRLLPSDYSYMADQLAGAVPAGRLVFFLEGGYDLAALEASVTATLIGSAGGPIADEDHRFDSPAGAYDALDRAVELVRRHHNLR